MMWISLIYVQSISALSVWEYVTGQRRPLCVERAVRETLPAVTHTHTHTAISHYTTQAMKRCVCVRVIECQSTDWKKRESDIWWAACRSSLLLPPSFSPRCSSARSLCSIIHTSPSSIHQNVHSIIIAIITIYQIISASSKNYSSHNCTQLHCFKISPFQLHPGHTDAGLPLCRFELSMSRERGIFFFLKRMLTFINSCVIQNRSSSTG